MDLTSSSLRDITVDRIFPPNALLWLYYDHNGECGMQIYCKTLTGASVTVKVCTANNSHLPPSIADPCAHQIDSLELVNLSV
jgi:hypothetical protein